MESLSILYQNESLVAVDKPSGWVVHHGMTRDAVACVQVLRNQLATEVFPVHRLDRGTSGVLLFALSSDAARQIQSHFVSGQVEKKYWAMVRGRPAESGLVDHEIPNDENGPRVSAQTRYRHVESITIDAFDRRQAYSIVEAEPLTGRFHQVRRHLKHLGHPLLGDTNYGRGEHNRLWRERFCLRRLALHASSIRVAGLEIVAPISEELLQAWERAKAAF